MRPTARTASIALLLPLLIASCASGGGAAPGQRLDVRIENNLIPPSAVSVYLVPESGTERYLGMVGSSVNTILEYRGLPPVGTYRLVARTLANRNVVSNAIVLDNVSIIEWSLGTNLVRIVATRS